MQHTTKSIEEKMEDEIFVLEATVAGNIAFIIVLFLFFEKIRQWRGDDKIF
jgi:hypothetical protein